MVRRFTATCGAVVVGLIARAAPATACEEVSSRRVLVVVSSVNGDGCEATRAVPGSVRYDRRTDFGCTAGSVDLAETLRTEVPPDQDPSTHEVCHFRATNLVVVARATDPRPAGSWPSWLAAVDQAHRYHHAVYVVLVGTEPTAMAAMLRVLDPGATTIMPSQLGETLRALEETSWRDEFVAPAAAAAARHAAYLRDEERAARTAVPADDGVGWILGAAGAVAGLIALAWIVRRRAA
jgi:hypothetical protein